MTGRTLTGGWMLRGALVLGMALGMGTVCARAQQQAGQIPDAGQPVSSPFPQRHPLLPGGQAEPDPMSAVMEAARERSLKNDRLQHMQADAAKLAALATEMKAEIDKMGKDEVSLEVLRKSDQIDKLTHDIRDRMKN